VDALHAYGPRSADAPRATPARSDMVRQHRIDASFVRLALILTFSTGIVDAGTYLSFDRVFAANMTGNVVYIGLALVHAGHIPILRPGVALGGFVVGAAVAGWSTRRLHASRRDRARAAALLCAVAGSLAVMTAMLVACPKPTADSLDVLTAAIAATMGVQAAAARLVAVADVSTVVVTSTLTAFASEPWFGGQQLARTVRRGLAVAAIVAGAVLGAGLVRFQPWAPTSVATAMSAWVAVRATQLSWRPARPTAD
jgi:uncharacterized membrane protein YoaK (UPF0700 family)